MLLRSLHRVGFVVLTLLGLSVLVQADQVPLADAVMAGDRDAVRRLLKDAVDVNAAQGDGMTALHWAAMRDDAEAAEMLLYAGANVRAQTRLGGYTPLLLAARQGHAAVLKPLLDRGADVEAATTNGTSALMFAASSGNADAVALLLDRGAKIERADPVRGRTALIFAATLNRVDVVRLLAKRGGDLKATTKVLDLAALSREPERTKAIDGGPPPMPQAPGAPQPPAVEGKPAAPAPPARRAPVGGVDRRFNLNELVYTQGGMTPLLLASRQGHLETVRTLLDLGADVNQVSAGDRTSPLLIATLNGQFDVAKVLLERGADPNLAGENGATPLYAALNCEWAPKSLYPQPRAYLQQQVSYLDLMKALLDKGADVNARLNKKVWYSGYSFDQSGLDEIGATPFWRAAYASDLDAMKLLIAHGADSRIRTIKPAGRPRTGDGDRDAKDISGVPPIPMGGPAITPLQAAAGAGYGESFAANSHRFAPTGMMAAVKYLVEELHVDVNDFDHEGNTAVHHAAARGDNEMIAYLVAHGADVTRVNREGKTTVDMANGPVQRIQPFPETIALLEKLGAKNNHKCISC
jgi:uncharacterized protein